MHVETDGPNVRALREASESSTRKFAKKAGVSRRTLTRVERNEGPVRPDTARKIGAALDVDPRTFARAVSRRPGPKEGEVSAKNTTEASPFLAEIERLMAEKGIEDLEELHERFMEQEPERIGNARWTFERFRKHATNVAGGLHFKFMRPLVRALEATDREQERLFFAWVGWDPPSGA